MPTYPVPTPEQLAAYRASYGRRQVGFLALNALVGLGLLAWFRWGAALEHRRAGLPLWFVAGVIGGGLLVFLLGVLVWQCPRCGQPFGRQLAVEKCPECHLRFVGP